MYLTDLATIARRTGFPVVEEWGWRTRGHGGMNSVQSVVCHHDAANLPPNRFNTVIRDGHSSLAGPLAQFALRQDGTIHVVAAGLCYHAGRVFANGYNNSNAVGIEANNSGVGEPWPDVQIRAYIALCGELAKAYNFPVENVRGHKEVAIPFGRKIDPNGINMSDFRRKVGEYVKGAAPAPAPVQPKDDFLMSLTPKQQADVLYASQNVGRYIADLKAVTIAQVNETERKVDRIERTLGIFSDKIDRIERTLWDLKQLIRDDDAPEPPAVPVDAPVEE